MIHTMGSSCILDLEVQLLASVRSLQLLGLERLVEHVPQVEDKHEEGGDGNHTSPAVDLDVVHTYL